MTEEFTRLETPRDGVPEVVDTPETLAACVEALTAAGETPIGVDAERASGIRYGQRAYLVQLRREGAGTWLIDPTAFDDLTALAPALAGSTWILHAATQDIPCLAEVGLRPDALFDTELGARLAGLPRVGLSAVLEYYLGITLAKEHSAVDWSTRPLPEPWLRYAALDVELLDELRERMAQDLDEQGKLAWAEQEFAALVDFPVRSDDDPDAWRRTSGASRARKPRQRAALASLWRTRDRIARDRDVAISRVLPDSTLVDLAIRMPSRADDLAPARKERSHTRQRRVEQGLLRHQRAWLTAIEDARAVPEEVLPPPPPRGDGPPPPRAWADRDPAAAERLTEVRARLAELSEELDIPVENLMTPDTVRRVLWRPPAEIDESTVDAACAEQGARPWQRQLVVPVLLDALDRH